MLLGRMYQGTRPRPHTLSLTPGLACTSGLCHSSPTVHCSCSNHLHLVFVIRGALESASDHLCCLAINCLGKCDLHKIPGSPGLMHAARNQTHLTKALGTCVMRLMAAQSTVAPSVRWGMLADRGLPGPSYHAQEVRLLCSRLAFLALALLAYMMKLCR